MQKFTNLTDLEAVRGHSSRYMATVIYPPEPLQGSTWVASGRATPHAWGRIDPWQGRNMLTVHHLGISQSERIVRLCEELGIP